VRWLSVARYTASLALYCTGVHLLHPQPMSLQEETYAWMIAWSGVVVMMRGKEL
jgi:hypothetical protein